MENIKKVTSAAVQEQIMLKNVRCARSIRLMLNKILEKLRLSACQIGSFCKITQWKLPKLGKKILMLLFKGALQILSAHNRNALVKKKCSSDFNKLYRKDLTELYFTVNFYRNIALQGLGESCKLALVFSWHVHFEVKQVLQCMHWIFTLP